MRPEERVERARKAEELLGNEILQECLKDLEVRCFQAFKSANSDEDRRQSQALAKAASILWDCIKRRAEDKELALREVKRLKIKNEAA